MDTEQNPAAEQWAVPQDETLQPEPSDKPNNTESLQGIEPNNFASQDRSPDSMKRRGFFEAIGSIDCPMHKLHALLDTYREEALRQMSEVETETRLRIVHLNEEIRFSFAKIEELKRKMEEADAYEEKDDANLQALLAEKKTEEATLLALQKKITNVRIRLGEAKAGIIDKSLEAAEAQVKKALGIQGMIYDETYALNKKKHEHEADLQKKLSSYYEYLYGFYQDRYDKIRPHLAVLDVDGISPVTTQVLVTIGSVSFAAAGLFFATFAGSTGFGQQDLLSYVFRGLVETANDSMSWYMKVVILLGLIVLVTGVSIVCTRLLERHERRRQKTKVKPGSEFNLNVEATKKIDEFEYQISIRSNNWYGLWLQLIPGILIASLIILGISKSLGRQAPRGGVDPINAANSSSEGLILGTFIAIAIAGLIYLYIVKVVEPRLVKRYLAGSDVSVNWIGANWELCVVLFVFVAFCIYTALVPSGMLSRYSILLFIGISLVGGLSFAYSVRSHGLIQLNRYMEEVLEYLNAMIALCSAPHTPVLHTQVEEEHGNLLRHVLRQLSFNATVDKRQTTRPRRSYNSRNFYQKVVNFFTGSGDSENQEPIDAVQALTVMEPWEERYFPHILDELKAVNMEYQEKKAKLQQIMDDINELTSARTAERRKCEMEITIQEKEIQKNREQIETATKEQAIRRVEIGVKFDDTYNHLQDGFHLGIWYRENNIGPAEGYFESCIEKKNGAPPVLLLNTPGS